MVKNKDQELENSRLKVYIMDNGKILFIMEQGLINIEIAIFRLVKLKKINFMIKELEFMQMKIKKRGIGKIQN